MLQLSPHSRIFIATEPVDFRKGIDGLAAVCRQSLGDTPLEGAVYVFRNRSATALKILAYDGQGFWLEMKRLSQGRFNELTGVCAIVVSVIPINAKWLQQRFEFQKPLILATPKDVVQHVAISVVNRML